MIALLFSCNSNTNSAEEDTTQENTVASNTQTETKAGSKPNAKRIYGIYCTSCHGNDGQAGISNAKNLAISTLEKPAIQNIIKNGSENKMMMAYGNMLDDNEINALADYVITLRTEESK